MSNIFSSTTTGKKARKIREEYGPQKSMPNNKTLNETYLRLYHLLF